VQGKIIELVENGVDFSVCRSDSSLSKAAAGQVHFIFLGRLIDWKAVDLLLQGRLSPPEGWLSHEQCALKRQQADALVLPSLREGGGAVVLEVMAVGLPVIATNWAVQGII
jgi:glycosyltransferase involved in cell wall biosynthesis